MFFSLSEGLKCRLNNFVIFARHTVKERAVVNCYHSWDS